MARKPRKGESLADLYPNLVNDWHANLNELSPYDFMSGSGTKVWWQCDKGDDHVWSASIKDRSKKGSGCPVCTGKKVVRSNCLATTHPRIAKEWHPTKNGDLTSFDVVSGSRQKVWWKCHKADDHEWQAIIDSRSRGSGCPMCSSGRMKIVVESNCLATTHPRIAKEWHPTKNGDLTPFDVVSGSKQKVWWKCDKGDDHEWYSSILNKSRGDGCSICAGQKIVKSNSLAILNPKLAKQWHPTKNGDLTPFDIGTGSNKKIWWKCNKGADHEWIATPKNRKNGDSCTVCSGKKVTLSNCFATTHPKMAKQWHPTKNGNLTPFSFRYASHTKIWWKCDKGDDHEWESTINSRTNRALGCPICNNKKVVLSNCLATSHPKMAREWHPTKNGSLTPFQVIAGTHKKIWWKCIKGENHEWIVSGNSRVRDSTGCPFCRLTPQSRQELTITFELIKFFKDINPKGFKTRINRKFWSIDIYIPKLNLGIEFDGKYWHKDKRALDKLKTKQLKEGGFRIIRIRQSPLRKITKDDVISKFPFNGKQVVNKVLRQIMKMYELDAKKISKIESYIAKKELQNEKGLDKYIDMILTEKAK